MKTPMVRIVKKVLGVGAALVVGVWGWLYLTAKPVTEREARRIATEEVLRSGQQLGFDPSIFQGPQPTTVGGAAYAFEWRFSDQQGTVDMLVWVDEYGGAEISWKGNLERLKTRH